MFFFGGIMKHIFKWVFIFILLLSSLAAAFFMILESGSFYQTLYTSKSHFYGYWAAALNELFMAIMAAVWITKKNKHGIKQPHIINYFFKLLLVVLFITTIAGASYYVALPILNNINNQENQVRILNIIDSQIENDKKSLDIFSAQNQKMNTALAAKRTWENHQQAKVIIKQNKHTFTLWFQLIIIIMLRFGIQSSNLGCVWLAGWLYRNNPTFLKTQDQKSLLQTTINEEIVTKANVHSTAENTYKPNNEKKSNAISDAKKQKSLLKSINKDKVATDPNISRKQPYPRKTEVLNIQDNIYKIRRQIVSYFNLRNEGVLLKDLAKVVGISEKSMMDIQNIKIPNHHFELENLERILSRCKSIFDHESASSF
jgi:hypothetical protein